MKTLLSLPNVVFLQISEAVNVKHLCGIHVSFIAHFCGGVTVDVNFRVSRQRSSTLEDTHQ